MRKNKLFSTLHNLLKTLHLHLLFLLSYSDFSRMMMNKNTPKIERMMASKASKVQEDDNLTIEEIRRGRKVKQ